MTLKPACRNGHPFTPDNTRYGSDGRRLCVACQAARPAPQARAYDPVKRRADYLANKARDNANSRRWYQNNTDRHKELMRSWYAATPPSRRRRRTEHVLPWEQRNREYHRALQRAWYQRNREAHLERSRAWSAANLPKKAMYRRARREREAAAPGFATPEQVAARIAFFGWRCAYCRGPFEELDHAIPLCRGGSAWPANLRPACESCNRRKNALTAFEFILLLADEADAEMAAACE